jgi:microcystin-dependent protein
VGSRPGFSPCGARTGAARSVYTTDCRWYVGGPVGQIRYYFVPASNAQLLGWSPFSPATELLSDLPDHDDGGTGEVGGAVRTYYRGTNTRPDLDGSHPVGTAQEFAGDAPVPTVAPPVPDCAQLQWPQWTLLCYGAVQGASGPIGPQSVVFEVDYLTGPVLLGPAGDVWSAPATLTRMRPLSGQAGDVWSAPATSTSHVPGLLSGQAGDVWSAPATLTYTSPVAHVLSGQAGDVWSAPATLTYTSPVAHVLSGQAGDVWGLDATQKVDAVLIAGTIIDYAGPGVPDGYARCDGSAYSQTDYPELYAAIGTTWNTFRGQAAPASGSFRVPKFDGLVLGAAGPIGSSPTTSLRALAGTAGEETHVLTSSEITNTGVSPSAGINFLTDDDSSGRALAAGSDQPYGLAVANIDGLNGAHNTIQPTAYVYKLIRTYTATKPIVAPP